METVYCNSLYEKSYELAQKLMEKYPDLEMIAGMNEYSAVGVGRAVSDAGVKDRIDVVGVDCSQEAINLMEMGVYLSGWVMDNFIGLLLASVMLIGVVMAANSVAKKLFGGE